METKIGSKGQSVVLYKVEALSYTYPLPPTGPIFRNFAPYGGNV